jgi:hypothetical protein
MSLWPKVILVMNQLPPENANMTATDGMTNVTIGSSVTNIGDSTFRSYSIRAICKFEI